MNNLPIEISLDIYSRLPVDTVLECRRVCKTWRNTLSLDKTNFFKMHVLRHTHGCGSSKVNQGLIFLVKSAEREYASCYPLYYGEFDENNSNHNEQCIQNTLRSIKKYCTSSLVGSCNGLICLVETRMSGFKDVIHICNPVTRESLYIHGFYIHEFNENNGYSPDRCGFGYSSPTNEYKVIKISNKHIYVYTLGSGSSGRGWRYKGVVTNPLYSQHGVFFNGALHWLGWNGEDIMAFDLSDEKFHVLRGPPFLVNVYQSILETFGEGLCVSVKNTNTPTGLDIWTYKKTLPEKSTAGTESTDESWSWCMEFSLTLEIPSTYHCCTPLAVTKSGLVLLQCTKAGYYSEQTLFCYDPKTATMKRHGIWNYFEVIPHTSSFVKLESLGEATCKKRKK